MTTSRASKWSSTSCVLRRDSDRIELSEGGWPPPPPKVSLLEHGYQYLSEVRLAGINEVVEKLRDAYIDLGLPLRSIEDEWGPGQLEVRAPAKS